MNLILTLGGNNFEIVAVYFPMNCEYENACWIRDNKIAPFVENVNNALIWVNNSDAPLTEKVSETNRIITWLDTQYNQFNQYWGYISQHLNDCNNSSKCKTLGVRDCKKSSCNCRTSQNDLESRYSCAESISWMMGGTINSTIKAIEELQENATEYVEFETLVANANILISKQNQFTAEVKKIQEEAKIQDFVSKVTRYILPGIAILILFYFIFRKK